MRLSHLVLLAGAAFAISACGKKSSSSPLNQAVSFAGNPVITNQSLDGVWNSKCETTTGGSGIEHWNFLANNTVNLVVPYYPSSDCSGGPEMTLTLTGTIQLFGASTSVSGATESAITVQPQISIVPGNNSFAQAMNASDLCGRSNWQANVAQSVTASATCFSDFQNFGGEALLAISGNQLFMGDDVSNTIDTTQPLTRVSN